MVGHEQLRSVVITLLMTQVPYNYLQSFPPSIVVWIFTTETNRVILSKFNIFSGICLFIALLWVIPIFEERELKQSDHYNSWSEKGFDVNPTKSKEGHDKFLIFNKWQTWAKVINRDFDHRVHGLLIVTKNTCS